MENLENMEKELMADLKDNARQVLGEELRDHVKELLREEIHDLRDDLRSYFLQVRTLKKFMFRVLWTWNFRT